MLAAARIRESGRSWKRKRGWNVECGYGEESDGGRGGGALEWRDLDLPLRSLVEFRCCA